MKRGSFSGREDVKIVADAVNFTRQVLRDNELLTFERLLRVHEGTYVVFDKTYFGALYVARDCVEGRGAESAGGSHLDTRYCASRINYGVMLQSRDPQDINLLNLVDMYFSGEKTKLWFPWMDYDLVQHRKNYGKPVRLCGSLWVLNESFNLQRVLTELTFAEDNVRRFITQTFSRILGKVETPRYILPMDPEEGSAEHPSDTARHSCLDSLVSEPQDTFLIHLQPRLGSHNVYLFSGSEDELKGASIASIALRPVVLTSRSRKLRLERPRQ